MTAANDDVVRSVTLPTLPGPQGPVSASRQPRVKDGLAFMALLEDNRETETATEAFAAIRARVNGARDLLLGMGFPAELVDDLSGGEMVKTATSFFLADLGLKMESSGS